MEYRRLGTTDLQVSSIGLGCVTFGREIDRETAFRILDHATERGISLLDTAAAYAGGASEQVVGDWMSARGSRNRIVLATKVHGTLSREQVITSAEDSLKRLQTDQIDLFQLHHWSSETPLEETLEGLAVLQQQGKIRYAGCSNWKAWQLCRALLLVHRNGSIPISSVQPPYNLVQKEVDDELLPLCADQRVGVLTYSPLAAGFLTGKYRRDGQVPSGTRFDVIPGHQPIYFTDRGFGVVAQLERIARQTGRSMTDLALAWVLSRPHITAVLIGSRHTGQIDQAFSAEQAGLAPDLRQQLDSL